MERTRVKRGPPREQGQADGVSRREEQRQTDLCELTE
jgi:hypothetical protein